MFRGSSLLGHWLYCLVRVWNITIKLVETYGRLVLCFISVFLFYIFSHKLLFKLNVLLSYYDCHILFTTYQFKSPIYICFCFKMFKIWKLGNFNKLSYHVISLKFRFVIFTTCSQETLLDKVDRLEQPYYHSYHFEFYSFQLHINMIRFFNVQTINSDWM